MSDKTSDQSGGKPSGPPQPEEVRAANHGILDPAEPGHRLPEGLERKRAGPLPRAPISKESGV